MDVPSGGRAPAQATMPPTGTFFGHLADALTGPSPHVHAPEQRRRARLLAALLLVLLVATIAFTVVVPLLVAPEETAANRTLLGTGAACIAIGLAVYVLSRSRWYEAAAGLTVIGALFGAAYSTITAQGTLWGEGAPYFLTLALILASVLLSIPATVLTASTIVLLVVVFYEYLPTFTLVDLSNTLTFLVLAAIVLLFTAVVRRQDLLQIRHQADRLADSEARTRSLFEASFEGLVLHDEGRIVDANPAAGALFGHDPAALLGQNLSALSARESQPQVDHKTRTLAHETHEAEGIRSDGSRFPVEFISKPYLHRGRLLRATAFRDITERMLAEAAVARARELIAANEKLQELDQLKTHILNTASHELNTPITPLRMQVHMLRKQTFGAVNERQMHALDIVDRNVERLSLLVNDMLQVSRLERGAISIRPDTTDLGALVADHLASFREAGEIRQISLGCEIPSPTWVQADPKRIGEVLDHLLSNALKATPPGGSIIVHAEPRGDELEVRVTDTGIGLSPTQLSGLFRPFGLVHDPVHTKLAGSGLGLYIARGIVEGHGGAMRAESPGPGKGATVGFTVKRS